jgi:amidohydrolase
VEFDDEPNAVVVNDPALSERMRPSLERAAAPGGLVEMPFSTVSEDFSAYSSQVPTLFVFVGSTAPGLVAATAPSNHSPLFLVDEDSLTVGLRTMLGLALDYLRGSQP